MHLRLDNNAAQEISIAAIELLSEGYTLDLQYGVTPCGSVAVTIAGESSCTFRIDTTKAGAVGNVELKVVVNDDQGRGVNVMLIGHQPAPEPQQQPLPEQPKDEVPSEEEVPDTTAEGGEAQEKSKSGGGSIGYLSLVLLLVLLSLRVWRPVQSRPAFNGRHRC